jgi:aspartate/methionine/tyrosine aminotransferase
MSIHSDYSKLTDWEWDGLTAGYNLADGHAHQAQNAAYTEIIDHLPELFMQAQCGNQKDIQQAFEQAFFNLAGQRNYQQLRPPLYQSACSLSIEVVANYLRQTAKSVAMLHPTFDNLADILKRHNIQLTPIDEASMLDPDTKLKDLSADVLFLVLPNNPTGTDLNQKQYLSIIEYCKKYAKMLIVDNSFRFYSSLIEWDQYAALKSAGIDFIIFEDTGKTWPTLELKIGITVSSDSVYEQLATITNDFLLNVSPFVFTVLTNYINSETDGIVGARTIVSTNREMLMKLLSESPISLSMSVSNLSVGWIKLPKNWEATALCLWLGEHGIHVLPGSPFYWNDHSKGESYIRVALLRPIADFKKAARQLVELLDEYQ